MSGREFGRIRQLRTRHWRARYLGGSDRDAATPRTFVASADANESPSSAQTGLARGIYMDPGAGRETLSDYSERWMAGRRDLRPRTFELYRMLLDRCLFPSLAAVEVGRITPSIVRRWHTELLTSGRCGPSLVPKAYRLLHTILASAVDDELITRNPCKVKGASVERSAERVPATVAQVYAAAAVVPPRYRALVLMAAMSGLRQGELFALTRDRLDLVDRTVKVVEQQVEPDRGPRYIGPPKTAAGRRSVSLPDVLVPELEVHLARWVQPGSGALVFTAPHGGPLNRHNFSRMWRRMRAAAGLPDGFTFHDLRHTANLLAASTGASTAELMARMGHSSPRAALRYQHATRDRDAAIADAMSAVVEGVAPAVAVEVEPIAQARGAVSGA